MGPLQNIIGMLPGVPKELKNVQIEDREVARIEAIIRAMTPAEREDPSVINGSRRTRIANGSGVMPSEVSNLLKQFKEMQKMMKGFGGKAMIRKAKGNKKKKGGRVTAKS
jgi:signal recognition particle subunit SRP54